MLAIYVYKSLGYVFSRACALSNMVCEMEMDENLFYEFLQKYLVM